LHTNVIVSLVKQPVVVPRGRKEYFFIKTKYSQDWTNDVLNGKLRY